MTNNYLENPLLLIIDMQNVYNVGQPWECQNYCVALDNIKHLIGNPLSTGNPFSQANTILTRYIASDSPFGVWIDYNKENNEINQNAWANALEPELEKLCKNYKCYDKSTYSAYTIKEIQKAADTASCVIITGVVAECCVLSTVMSLIDAGKYVYYVTDAIASATPETEQATVKVLEGLTYVHLKFITTSELCDMLEHNNQTLTNMNLF